MLDRTKRKLQSYYNNEQQMGVDGQLYAMDRVTRIDQRQCERIGELHKSIKPNLSLEVGLAYGFSTLPILDAMEEYGYGHHIAMDPSQVSHWHGVALTSINQLGFAKRFTWLSQSSDQAMVELFNERRQAQFVFLDGLHSFDGILVDFFLVNKILDVGGVVVFNQKWMPVGRAITSFISTNISYYKYVPIDSHDMFVFRKEAEDNRDWDHFVSFDGSGKKSENATKEFRFLRRLLSRS